MIDDLMIIKHNPNKKYPYETWLGGELIDTFANEETAKEMLELHNLTKELYIKNQYEKFVLHRDGNYGDCLHKNSNRK